MPLSKENLIAWANAVEIRRKLAQNQVSALLTCTPEDHVLDAIEKYSARVLVWEYVEEIVTMGLVQHLDFEGLVQQSSGFRERSGVAEEEMDSNHQPPG